MLINDGVGFTIVKNLIISGLAEKMISARIFPLSILICINKKNKKKE